MTESCVSTIEAFLAGVETLEPTLRAFTEINPKQILKEAKDLDNLRSNQRGPLHGLLIAIKEVYDVKGYVCGWGTPIHNSRKPQQDSAVVSQLRTAGAIIAGITVSTEYAISNPGPTTNPHDNTRTPGASSQGSAAAVAAGLVTAALGSQTIGSVIRPAAYCGCIGFKPSWGLIDVHGSMPLAEPIDHPGMFTRDIETMIAIASTLQPKHKWRKETPIIPKAIILEPWYKESNDQVVIDALERVYEKLLGLKIEVERQNLPQKICSHEEELVVTLLTTGMARNHGGDFDRARSQMSQRVREYILAGRAVSEQKYQTALQKKESLAKKLDNLLEEKVFITAATTGVAPLIHQGTGSRAPQRIWTLTGLPTITIPFDSYKGLPVGIQIGAARGADQLVLAMANVLLEDFRFPLT